MQLESSKKIFNKLNEIYFPKEIEPIYDLIKKYKNRIHFVKDHNGLKNVLFFATSEAANEVFSQPYFAIFEEEKQQEQDIEVTIARAFYHSDDILSMTQSFLEKTNETLYVGVGFVENDLTYEDKFRIFHLMEDTKCNLLDAYVTFRKFPEWYDEEADYPLHIIQEEELLIKMTEQEKQFIYEKKQELLNEMNSIVEDGNKEKFDELKMRFKRIEKQLSEY